MQKYETTKTYILQDDELLLVLQLHEHWHIAPHCWKSMEISHQITYLPELWIVVKLPRICILI